MPYNDATINLYHSGSWNDISEYVIGSDETNMYEKNITWEPIISEFEMNISQAIGYLPERDDILEIYYDATHYYHFVITDVERDYQNRTYNITVKKDLYKLQQMILNDDNVARPAADNAPTDNEYIASDNAGYSNFQLLYILQQMFELNDLTLDTGSVADENLGFAILNRVEYSSNPIVDVYAKNLKVDYNILLMFGTGESARSDQYSPNWDKRKYCWDYVKEVCTHFGWAIEDYEGGYKLISMASASNYSVSESLKYDYDLKDYDAQYSSSQYEVHYSPRNYYYQTSASLPYGTDLYYTDYTNGVSHIEKCPYAYGQYIYQMPDSFRYMIRNEINPDNSGSIYLGVTTEWGGYLWYMFYDPNYGTTYKGGLNRTLLRNAYENDYKIETIESDITLDFDKKIISLKVDLGKRTQTIEQVIIE